MCTLLKPSAAFIQSLTFTLRTIWNTSINSDAQDHICLLKTPVKIVRNKQAPGLTKTHFSAS